jgi:ubiquinone/menaquinone biosynthesis C-methylase UbiE
MDISRIFNEFAHEYDKTRRQFIPCFDAFYSTVIQLIPFSTGDSFEAMDLGAGTGLLSQFVIATFPNARITLIDIADQMLEQAKTRLQSYGNQMCFKVSDYAVDDISDSLERYDLILSALSIHHLSSLEKHRLFMKIYSALKKGGLFINADQTLGETPEINELYMNNWWSRIRSTSLTEKDFEAAQGRMLADKKDPLSHQLQWLKEIGFVQENCWFSDFSFSVYSGQKPKNNTTDSTDFHRFTGENY